MSQDLIVPGRDETQQEPKGSQDSKAASALDAGVDEVLDDSVEDKTNGGGDVIDLGRQPKRRPGDTTLWARGDEEEQGRFDIPSFDDERGEGHDPIAEGIREARKRGEEESERSRRRKLLKPIPGEPRSGGTSPPDGPTEPPSGGGAPRERRREERPLFSSAAKPSSSWRKLLFLLGCGFLAVIILMIGITAYKASQEIPQTEPTAEQAEQAQENTERSLGQASYVEQSAFNESQVAQDGKIVQNGQAIDELDDRVETLEGQPALSPAEIAKQSTSSARAQVRPVEERVTDLERRLGDTIRSIPGMVNSEAIEGRIREVEDATLRNKDAIDVHEQQIAGMNTVVEGHQSDLRVHETRLREAEQEIDRHTLRLDSLEREFEELSGARRMSIQIQCARINGGGSPNIKHHADVLALTGNNREAAKNFCKTNFSPPN